MDIFSFQDDASQKIFKSLTDDFRGEFAPDDYSSEKVTQLVSEEYLKSQGAWKSMIARLIGVSDKKVDPGMIKLQLRKFRKYKSATIYFCRY